MESDGLEVKLLEFTRENEGKFTPFVLGVKNTTNRQMKAIEVRVTDMKTKITGNRQVGDFLKIREMTANELPDHNNFRKIIFYRTE